MKRMLLLRPTPRLTFASRVTMAGLRHSCQSSRLVFLLLLSGVGSGVLSSLGCGGDTTGPSTTSTTQEFWTIALNQHAVNLSLTAPNNTFQLTATPLGVNRTPLSTTSHATFQTSDSSVTVDSTGRLFAHFATAATNVVVSLTAQGVTLRDTVVIQVTPSAPPVALATFSLQPAVGDSAKRTVDSTNYVWTVTAVDVNHNTVCVGSTCPFQVYYTSSDPAVALIDRATGLIQTVDTGHVVFTATMWAYGVAWRDSVVFTIGYNLGARNAMKLDTVRGVPTLKFSSPPKAVLGVGAVVLFWNQSPYHVNVVFDHQTGVDPVSATFVGMTIPPTGSGNLPAFGGDSVPESFLAELLSTPFVAPTDFSARRFTVPGIYRYHSTSFPSDTLEFEIRQQQ